MHSKGSRFTRGVWGLRVCSLDVAFTSATLRNLSQPFATVRNRPHEVAMAMPKVSSAIGVTFGGFQRRVASFRMAGMVLCDIQTCFATCQTSFSEDELHFSWQVQHLGDLHLILRGRCSTSDVSCCIFSVNRIVKAAQSGAKGHGIF